MDIIKISPRGYCYGVVDAMVIARNASLDQSLPRPIYILGMIVHNKHVTDAFEEEGIITLDGPNRLGVSPQVKARAKEKGLVCIDATCPDVEFTHDLIREKTADDYDVIYIGKKDHPEPEGAIGVSPDHVHLIETQEDVATLPDHLADKKLIVTNQTTMSQWDVSHIMDELKVQFPHIEVHKEICLATQVRQEAVAEQAGEADLLIVVGDPKSNNSNRLTQVSKEIAHTNAYRISSLNELKNEWLEGVEKVAVTAGASTPTPIVKEVIAYIKNYNIEQQTAPQSSVPMAKILPKIKNPTPVQVME